MIGTVLLNSWEKENKNSLLFLKINKKFVFGDSDAAKFTLLTKEDWFSPIGLGRAQDLPVSQVLQQNDGEPRLVEGLHDNRTHGLVVGKEVEDGEEEEEAEGQAAGRREDEASASREQRQTEMLSVTTLTAGYRWPAEWGPNWPAAQPGSLKSPTGNKSSH